MSETLRWWLIMQMVAVPLLPLCLAAFRRVPDRGYALSKPFALLFLGYVFWLLNSLQIVPNSARGIIGALVVLTAISAVFAYRERDGLRAWFKEHWRYVAGVEALLLVTFLVAVWLRSYVGQIQGTEQPMDLMFLNATTRADHFPPEDPWLSGHTVAYYYFGYLIVAMTGRLAAVSTEVGYNIGLGMVAALALVAAAGLVYNLVKLHADVPPAPEAKPANSAARALPFDWRPPAFGIAGGLILVIMGNLVWVLVFASAYGFGGRSFYDWIDVSGLAADELKHGWYPSEYFGFFNASRIYPLNDQDFRAITEFPMFSFLLGDLHPHVMALPFVLLVVGAALTLYRSPEPLDVTFWLQRPILLVAISIMLGGLAFLNTWDIATMAFVVVAAAFVSNFGRVRGFTLDLVVQTATFALPLVVLAIVLYVPFYASFTSQADGVLPVVTREGITVPGTRPLHLLLHWGPLLALVGPFVAARLLAVRERISRRMVTVAVSVPVTIVLMWVVLFLIAKARDTEDLATSAGLFAQIGDRGSGWVSAVLIGAMLSAGLLALWVELTSREEKDGRQPIVFGLLLASTAFLLMLGTEFFYVGDVFNSRMNTVFKLYYQGWLLLALAGGFSLYYLAGGGQFSFKNGRQYRLVWGGAAAIVLAGAALYPLGGTFNRTAPYNQQGERIEELRGLDGLSRYAPDETKAIAWLRDRAQGQEFVIVEAFCPVANCSGNDYSSASRISAATGVPAVLGWAGHEDQWRGGTAEARAGRFEDVERLYKTADMAEVDDIVNKYGITYIYVGELERKVYGAAAVAKFESLPAVFQDGATTIYLAKGSTGEVEAAQ